MNMYNTHVYCGAVFFNLFFEAEPFASILVDHGTHGRSQEFVFLGTREAPRAEIRGLRPRAGKEFFGRGQRATFPPGER